MHKRTVVLRRSWCCAPRLIRDVWSGLGCLVGLSVLARAVPATAQAATYTVLPAEQISHQLQPTPKSRVTLDWKDSTVESVVNAIANQLHLKLVYNNHDPLFARRITVNITSQHVSDAFATVLKGTGLVARFTSDGEMVAIRAESRPANVEQVGGMIIGHVTDSASGAGLGGASVRVADTKLSSVTSDSGHFTLRDVPTGEQVLSVRLFGYKPIERTVTVVDSQLTTVRIVMIPIPTVLSGVVTTASGIQNRLAVGNDITVLNVDSIRNIAPITSVTDLIATRVPGLIVLPTSGVPGAPSRVRIRGTSSPLQSNDPIVIVNGIRVYADQSGSSAGNASGVSNAINVQGGSSVGNYAGPSPLDQIDPSSIETIEVLKGPSASAIYGSDAANGVIIITTKQGRAGPTHWTLAVDNGRTMEPGDWPKNYFRFGVLTAIGVPVNGPTLSAQCSPYQSQCIVDSVVAFQALNNPQLSPLQTGQNRDVNLNVNGGDGKLTYSVGGIVSSQLGILHLPAVIADEFETLHGFPPPEWMQQPDVYSTWGTNDAFTMQLGRQGGTVQLTNSLFSSAQQQGSFENAIGQMEHSYFNTTTLAAVDETNSSDNFPAGERAQLNSLTSTNALSLNWPLTAWMPFNATAGLSLYNTNNNTVQPRDYSLVPSIDTLGSYQLEQGSVTTRTFNVQTTIQRAHVSVPIGFNVHAQSQSQFSAATTGLAPGVLTPSSLPYAIANTGPSLQTLGQSTYGWFFAPTLDLHSRLFISPGIRLDGGSASGTQTSLNPFPKIDVSYVAVNRPASDPLFGVVTLFRPRIAFGIAGVQPGPTEQERLYEQSSYTPVGSSTPVEVADLASYGNTQLVPERSRELEGGFDAALWDQRLTLTLTGYYKMRYDAIEPVYLAPSVFAGVDSSLTGVASEYVNIGNIRNTGIDAAASARIVDGRFMSWSVDANLTRDRSDVVSLLPGVSTLEGNGSELRVGYPYGAIFQRPVLGYADVNGDGIIEPSEVRLADSAVYIGAQEPNYELDLSTTVSFWSGRLSVNTAISYQNGLTQYNQAATLSYNSLFGSASVDALVSRVNDPSSSQGEQALIAAALNSAGIQGGKGSTIGLYQTVSTLRWSTLSINYILPRSTSHWFRVTQMSLALQGSNLALRTNYHGKDPNVNSQANGNGVSDTGQIPDPRVFSLRLSLQR